MDGDSNWSMSMMVIGFMRRFTQEKPCIMLSVRSLTTFLHMRHTEASEPRRSLRLGRAPSGQITEAPPRFGARGHCVVEPGDPIPWTRFGSKRPCEAYCFY